MLTAACCAVLITASCHHPEHEQETALFEYHGDTLLVPLTSPLTAKISLHTVAEQPYQLQLLTAGIVKAIPANYAAVAPPFAGRVVTTYARLGDRVRAGDPLFAISSPDFFAAQKSFFQARQLRQQALTVQRRQQDLEQHAVGAMRDLEEANTNLALQQQEYENAAAALRVFNARAEQLALGAPLVVTAPIAGEVITDKVVTGQYLTAGDGPVSVIAQLSEVWIAGQVKEKDLRFIHENDGVSVEVNALPDTTFSGKVFHISRTIDESTRAAEVLMLCANPGYHLKPGMYASVNFLHPAGNIITIPAKAVMQENDHSYVWAAIAPGRYIRRRVVAGETNGQQLTIRSGLQPGDKIIGEGAFYFSAAK